MQTTNVFSVPYSYRPKPNPKNIDIHVVSTNGTIKVPAVTAEEAQALVKDYLSAVNSDSIIEFAGGPTLLVAEVSLLGAVAEPANEPAKVEPQGATATTAADDQTATLETGEAK